MKLVTWNLNGLEPRQLDARTETALQIMLLGGDIEAALAGRMPPMPDVIVLQEVVERTYLAHLVPHLRAAGYQIVPPQPPARSYFELVAARGISRAQWVPFERSGQGRALLHVELDTGVHVMTAHLESLGPNSEIRVEQAASVLERLDNRERAVFAGDTNLRKAEWDGLEKGLVRDAWEQAGSPKSERATWGRARFDRVWTRGLEVQSFERIGVQDVPGLGEPPSDHVGLAVQLK